MVLEKTLESPLDCKKIKPANPKGSLDYTVVRPLIGMDKLEIIEIAKEIGTFDISIRPTDGCTIVPIKPVTEASVEKIGTFESVVDTDALARTTAEAAVRIS